MSTAQIGSAQIDSTDLGELNRRQASIDRLLMAEGAGHIVHDLPIRADGRAVGLASRPWRLDPIPYVIQPEEFLWLEEAISRRMRMLEAVLDDLYGDRRTVAYGVLDPADLWGSDHYRLAAVGRRERRGQRRWLSSYAVDVVRTADGVWFATADHTDAPSGLGYAMLDRAVLDQASEGIGGGPRPLEPALDAVRRALFDATSNEGPRVAVFTGGIDHPAYVEHSYLATLLGFNLVEGPDLVVRDRHLWLQTLGGLELIDVLYRRLGDRQLDPMETNTTGSAGIPGVLLADEAGSLTMANAHGTGVLEDTVLAGRFDAAGEMLTGEAPWLTRVPPGPGGIDVLLGRPAERVDVFLDGFVQQLPIVLRFHAVATNDGVRVIPGANGRVLFPSDDPSRPTPCLAKDTWVLGEVTAPPPRRAHIAPQVDLITSVPTRAADSLYWLCRAAERAEAVARACRVMAASGAGSFVVGRPTVAMHLVAALTGPLELAVDENASPAIAPGADLTARQQIIASASASLEFHIGSMLAESATVREFLSATTGRILGEMVETRRRLVSSSLDVDALDGLLFELSAFAGLWSESVVRGPAWYFGDYARRYERAVVALTGASTAIRCGLDPARDDMDRHRGLEAVLAANDSLVAYRRRHRSDVELDDVLRLLLHDERNPRSAAASMAGLDRNARAIGWDAGLPTLERIRAALASVKGVDPVTPLDAGRHHPETPRRGGATHLDPARRAAPSDARAFRRGRSRCGGMTASAATSTEAGTLTYRVAHRTSYQYGMTVTDAYSLACLLPRDRRTQRVIESRITADPEPDEYDERPDVFGNRVVQLGVHHRHDSFEIVAESTVEVDPMPLPQTAASWESIADMARGLRGPKAVSVGPYRASTQASRPTSRTDLLGAIATEVFAPGRPIVEAVSALSTTIYEGFSFDPWATDWSTPLDLVLVNRRGVCQDFAHLAIAVRRFVGLPAAYMSGYIETEPPPGEPKSIGADASHAWCSIWLPEYGWFDIDPTNDQAPPTRHVTVAWGRDYADVAPVRGVVIGPNANQVMDVAVDVQRLA